MISHLKPVGRIPIVLTAITLLVGLPGCSAGYYYDDGPEWDGSAYVGDGYYRDHYHHYNAFRGDGGRHSIGTASDRGRSSIGGPQ